MKHFIELTDEDVLVMDDETGNIVISSDNLPGKLAEHDEVEIHYAEDPANITHKYILKDLDLDNSVVTLDWKQQLGESLLTEAPLSKMMQKAAKKADKADVKDAKRAQKYSDKILKNAKKLIARDLGPEGRTWKFYFAIADGKYAKAVDYNTAKAKYTAMGDDLTPEVANAIVTTDTGFIVRRGMEDLYRKGIKLTKQTAKIPDNYKLPWAEEDPFEGDTTEETPVTPSSTEAEEAASKSADEKATPSANPTTNKNGISSNSYSHFLKLLYVMRPKLFDAFDKPVDVSNIKTLADKVKYNNLADFKIEIDGKRVPAINWIKTAVKNKVLMEKVLNEAPVIQLDADDLMNPDKVDFKDKIRKAAEKEHAEAETKARHEEEEKLKVAHQDVIDKLERSLSRGDTVKETLDMLHDELVPTSGPADSAAGELVRAIVRIMYRDYNDGDKFFEGYGIETCGSSAEYLFDYGFEEDIQNIIDNAYQLLSDDEKYTDALNLLGEHVIDRIKNDYSLIWTVNEEDSRDYSNDYIVENQPRYEFECYGSDDIVTLVDKGVLTSWDLNRYVDDMLSYEHVYEGAKASRPWGYHDTSVTVENLTKDGYERLEDSFKHNVDGWWEDLVSEYADELTDSDYDDDYDPDADENMD